HRRGGDRRHRRVPCAPRGDPALRGPQIPSPSRGGGQGRAAFENAGFVFGKVVRLEGMSRAGIDGGSIPLGGWRPCRPGTVGPGVPAGKVLSFAGPFAVVRVGSADVTG